MLHQVLLAESLYLIYGLAHVWQTPSVSLLRSALRRHRPIEELIQRMLAVLLLCTKFTRALLVTDA